MGGISDQALPFALSMRLTIALRWARIGRACIRLHAFGMERTWERLDPLVAQAHSRVSSLDCGGAVEHANEVRGECGDAIGESHLLPVVRVYNGEDAADLHLLLVGREDSSSLRKPSSVK